MPVRQEQPDEFVAEAFTNWKFQEALKGVPHRLINAEWRGSGSSISFARGFWASKTSVARRHRPGDDDRGAVDAGRMLQ